MTRNPILDELHAARRQILADWDGDAAAYLRDAQARLEASGRPISQRKQRTVDVELQAYCECQDPAPYSRRS